MDQANDAHRQRAHRRDDHQRRFERAATVGGSRDDRNRDNARDHRHRDDDADGSGVEPFGFEPKREKRQLDPAEQEVGGIEQPQLEGESIGG